MSDPAYSPDPLDWDLTDRMIKAMRIAGLNRTTLAERLGVDRTTINRWTTGKSEPRLRDLMAFAMACGVPYPWLVTGVRESPHPDGPDGGSMVRHQGLEPRTH